MRKIIALAFQMICIILTVKCTMCTLLYSTYISTIIRYRDLIYKILFTTLQDEKLNCNKI